MVVWIYWSISWRQSSRVRNSTYLSLQLQCPCSGRRKCIWIGLHELTAYFWVQYVSFLLWTGHVQSPIASGVTAFQANRCPIHVRFHLRLKAFPSTCLQSILDSDSCPDFIGHEMAESFNPRIPRVFANINTHILF